jgi:AcrR family transcriptional regulator
MTQPFERATFGDAGSGIDEDDSAAARLAPAETCSALLAQIRSAATESVAANGFGGMSIEDIALRAGCSRATIYRRVGGKEAIRDVVLNHAIARMTAAVALAVEGVDDRDRIESVIIASLNSIRSDPVSAGLLAGPVAASTADSAVISRFNGSVADLTGMSTDDEVGSELISRLTLALLCWPLADRRTEAALIHRFVAAVYPASSTSGHAR